MKNSMVIIPTTFSHRKDGKIDNCNLLQRAQFVLDDAVAAWEYLDGVPCRRNSDGSCDCPFEN
jgi:hypothetical protein